MTLKVSKGKNMILSTSILDKTIILKVKKINIQFYNMFLKTKAKFLLVI